MWYCDEKTWKIGKFQKTKKIWNLIVSKPENNNFRLKNAIDTKFSISRMKKHSFFADAKLQVDQIKKKKEEKFIKPLFT